ncbi:hypothetical protein FB45DRAFT_933134 [Roridomyces roridus]|uniref:Uncharacterized protein n=1 Tax=Roridomyces roridus TaxID=1738132 RepID=A0AAD7FGX7_9AGAR|nr:hypothetical protein FB45DRAFT_933134 [Roridomyces roridus]
MLFLESYKTTRTALWKDIDKNMFNNFKLFTAALFVLVLGQAAIAIPQGPAQILCGAGFAECGSGELCCGTSTPGVNVCQNGALLCLVPT